MNTVVISNKDHVASLDVHVQKTFTPICADEIPVPEGHMIVDELNLQASMAAKRIGAKEGHHADALWVANEHQPPLSPVEGKNVDVRWPAHSVVGTLGFELVDGLPAIDDYDYYVWQGVELDMHPYGVCYHDFNEKLSTGIIEYLRLNNIDTVIVGGLATDYCVKTSVLQLLNAGFKVVVNLAACRGVSELTTQQAIDEMQASGAQFIQSARELVHCDGYADKLLMNVL